MGRARRVNKARPKTNSQETRGCEQVLVPAAFFFNLRSALLKLPISLVQHW